MKITLQPTDQLKIVNGTLARLWIGTDEKQKAVMAYIAIIKVMGEEADFERFAQVLREVPKPTIKDTV